MFTKLDTGVHGGLHFKLDRQVRGILHFIDGVPPLSSPVVDKLETLHSVILRMRAVIKGGSSDGIKEISILDEKEKLWELQEGKRTQRGQNH